MNVFLRESLRSWPTWIFMGGLTAIFVAIVWLALLAQRREYLRATAEARAQAFEQLRREIQGIEERAGRGYPLEH